MAQAQGDTYALCPPLHRGRSALQSPCSQQRGLCSICIHMPWPKFSECGCQRAAADVQCALPEALIILTQFRLPSLS